MVGRVRRGRLYKTIARDIEVPYWGLASVSPHVEAVHLHVLCARVRVALHMLAGMHALYGYPELDAGSPHLALGMLPSITTLLIPL